jgi:protein-S-isoprenylcysteine O-methyltransferase Ste14
VKHKFWIDTHKGATGLAVLAIIVAYGAWQDARLWLYLGMHGTYGILWITKSRYFPDRSWERVVPLSTGIATWFGLSLYWCGPGLIASHRTAAPPAWWPGLCVAIFTTGIFLHFVSDMQKHMAMTLRPGVLLTDGLWSLSRNPNYLGELLVYGGFTMLVYHWAPLAVLALFTVGIWVPNMQRKDKSLSRYPEFAAWSAKTRRLIPFVY